MGYTIPGTVLTASAEELTHTEERFRSMFLGGGIVLSQVSAVTGLEPYTVQNWVKRGFLPKPENKRYSLRQLCRILNINMLKGVLPMERVCAMLGYINGQLDDDRDDTIDDSRLYFMFVRLAAHAKQIDQSQAWQEAIDRVLQDYAEPIPGARNRIAQVLRIMLIAYIAARMKDQAETLLTEIM